MDESAIQAVISLIELLFIALMIAGMWKAFTKAGEPGWASIIPIYNMIVVLKIANKPIWWIIFFFIPCLNIIFAILVMVSVAQAFGKSSGFGIGLALLGFIFWPILGFGDAQYGGTGGPQGFPVQPGR